jgi:hypothetical protein
MHYFAQGPMKLYDPVSEYSDLFVWMSLIEIYKYLQWLFYLYIVPHQVMWVTFSTWFQWSPIPIIRQSFSRNISLWKSVIFTNNHTFSSIFTCKNLSKKKIFLNLKIFCLKIPWIIFIFNLSSDIVVLNSFKNCSLSLILKASQHFDTILVSHFKTFMYFRELFFLF